ncbi:MAG: extracellular solute-binding protein, partial [Aristaeellaceae bacterium]
MKKPVRLLALVLALALTMTCVAIPVCAETAPIEVEFWHTLTGVNGEAVEAIAARFNETVGAEKGIHVSAVYQGNDNSEKLKTLAQANDFAHFPDVAMIAGAGIPAAYGYDCLVKMGDLMAREGNTITAEELEPNMLRSYTYAGEMIGMPFSCSAIMLYYNKDMFQE